MIITVTQEDIDKGTRIGSNCPVAISINRHTGMKVAVSAAYIYLAPLRSIETPKAVSEWVANYDQGYTVRPMSFELELP